jgi:hypothetical protein
MNAMQLSPSWEANGLLGSQEIPSILQNPEVHNRAHNSPSLHPILSQIQSMTYNCKIRLRPGLPRRSFPLCFYSKTLHALIFFSTRTTWRKILQWILKGQNGQLWSGFIYPSAWSSGSIQNKQLKYVKYAIYLLSET